LPGRAIDAALLAIIQRFTRSPVAARKAIVLRSSLLFDVPTLAIDGSVDGARITIVTNELLFTAT